MLIRKLQSFEPFANLRAPELQTIAQHAQVVHLPSGRWLLRPGRRLTGAYFLLQGRLQLYAPELTLVAEDPAATKAFYPGTEAVKTLSTVQVLQVDLAPIEFLWQSLSSGGVDTLSWVGDEVWLSRFLNSPMLCPLTREQWQGLLQGSRVESMDRRSVVVRAGQPADDFFVLKRGSAKVERGGKVLAHLSPGDFFGEDALVTGSPRNATVTMSSAGELLRLGKRQFLRYLVAQLLEASEARHGAHPTRSRNLWVGLYPPARGTPPLTFHHVPLYKFREVARELPARQLYRIFGGAKEEQALALLLLSQQGLRGEFAQTYVEPITLPPMPVPFVRPPTDAAG